MFVPIHISLTTLFYHFLVSPAHSLIFDNIRHSTDPLPSGAVGMATPDVAGAAGSAGMLPFQVQFIKNLIDESLDEFRYEKLCSENSTTWRDQTCTKQL